MGYITRKNWTEIENRMEDLYSKVIELGFRPDCIVGIARGGLIPAVILAYKLNCRLLGFIQFQRTTSDDPFALCNETNILHSISLPETKIDRILIVDDIIVKGIIFRDAIAIITRRYSRIDILGAFLYKVPGVGECGIHPHVFSELVNPDEWVIYPWEE